jgi:putative lipoic acid-binding regulatory protein
MTTNSDCEKLKEFGVLLNEEMEWPSSYTFKFIVKKDQVNELEEILQGHTFNHRPSRSGKYISITATKIHLSSSDIINIYQKVSKIEGIVSL